jgi:LacI family transcriptional regulator
VKRRNSFEEAVRRQADATVKSWRLNAQGTNGRAVAGELLADDLRPTAVFAASDHEAQFVYEAAAEMGKQIPRDLSVVGFADLDFAATMDPPLTTMRQKPVEIGRLAASLIMDRIDGIMPGGGEPTTVKVAAQLIVRNSTGRCGSS